LVSKVIEMVGSSTISAGSASTCSGSQTVSEMRGSGMPEKAMMSPAVVAANFGSLAVG
jgi:hypothetical protein